MSEAIAQVPLINGGFRGIVDMKRWCYTTAILRVKRNAFPKGESLT